MMLDPSGHDPEEAPVPPARTRLAEESRNQAEEGDVLLPPYIPGREPAASADESFPFEGTTPAEPEPFPFEEKAAPDVDEAFPFDEAAQEETEAFPFEEMPPEAAEPFPFDATTPEETEGGAFEEEAGSAAAGAFPFDEPDSAGAFPAAGETAAVPEDATDDFPFEAFDLGGGETAEPIEEEPAPGEMFGDPEPTDLPAPDVSTQELADRLEWLAQALRTEGREALRREVSSGDRMTALMAGVLSGYLAGQRD
ncbi:MAG TPA: hypothetical protein VK966_12865 [Longimicrobiales bacterium]|nr:hypothetical protein [Longimicrobiales bacterium]